MSKSKQLDVVFLSLSMNDLDGGNPDDTMHHADKIRSFYEFPPILWPSQMNQLNKVNRDTDAMFKNRASIKSAAKKSLGDRSSSIKTNGLKSIDESINSRYKHVSIFSWYTPKDFKKSTR
jgi:hypothetical protein